MLDCGMQISVERLRVGLLAGAGVLVLATAAFLGYVRFSGRQDIRRETNAFTYSQTVKGRTRFTVHAAKAIRHSDGKYTLHDAEIVLYDQDGEKQANAVYRIYGKQFEYDPDTGGIRAVGEVQMDLKAPRAD
jgi:lipopolysaccharide export system protein LptA